MSEIGNADAGRRAVRHAGQVHEAAHALRHQVVAGALGVRPVLAEAGDRAIDQPRAFGAQALVVEPELGEPADLEVLDQDVGFGRQLLDDALAFLAFEVDFDRALAAIGGMEIGRADMAGRRRLQRREGPTTRIVTGALALDLDDVGAKIGQRLPGPGTGQNAGKFKDADTRERFGHDEKLQGRWGRTAVAAVINASPWRWPDHEFSLSRMGLPANSETGYGAVPHRRLM